MLKVRKNNMYLNLSIELYEEVGQKWVYIAEDNSSGAKYTYNDKEELKVKGINS